MSGLLSKVALLVMAGSAQAAPGTEDWRVWGAAYTDVPTQVAAALEVGGPGGLRLSTGLGWMPSGFIELSNQVAVQFEGYSAAQGDAVVAALQDSMVWQSSVGWQPWRGSGFSFDVGYQLLTLGGTATSESLLVIATGVAAPEQTRDVDRWRYTLGVTVHRARVGLNWRWWLDAAETMSLTARVGGEVTLAASSVVEPELLGFNLARAEHFAHEVETELDSILEQYLHYPTVGLSFGYQLD
jgi:hypothetical protein